MKESSIVFILLLLMVVIGTHYHYSTKDRTQPKYRLIMSFVIYPSICMFIAFIVLIIIGK